MNGNSKLTMYSYWKLSYIYILHKIFFRYKWYFIKVHNVKDYVYAKICVQFGCLFFVNLPRGNMTRSPLNVHIKPLLLMWARWPMGLLFRIIWKIITMQIHKVKSNIVKYRIFKNDYFHWSTSYTFLPVKHTSKDICCISQIISL